MKPVRLHTEPAAWARAPCHNLAENDARVLRICYLRPTAVSECFQIFKRSAKLSCRKKKMTEVVASASRRGGDKIGRWPYGGTGKIVRIVKQSIQQYVGRASLAQDSKSANPCRLKYRTYSRGLVS